MIIGNVLAWFECPRRGDWEGGVCFGVRSLDSDLDDVEPEEKKEGVGRRLGMKFEGKDIEGRAFDNRLNASAPPEDDLRCRA